MTWLLPHLPFPSTGRRYVAPAGVAGAIRYTLNTGGPWRWLPVAALCSSEPLT